MLKKGGEAEVKLAMDMLEPVIIERAKQVVDARHKFARNVSPGRYPVGAFSRDRGRDPKVIFG